MVCAYFSFCTEILGYFQAMLSRRDGFSWVIS